MSDNETAPEMLARLGTDAMLWAQEFNKTAIKLGYSEMDEGWLIGWFASAIESCDVIRGNRLRADLAAANTRMSKLDFERTAAELERDALRAENKRLREALKPLAAITLWTDKYPDGPLSVGDNQRYIDPQWIVRARAALEGVTEPASPWRDIESAPKDGTAVLLGGGTWSDDFRDESNCVRLGWWELPSRRNRIGFWNTCAANDGCSMFEYKNPTHWMPLPQPPQQSGDGGTMDAGRF